MIPRLLTPDDYLRFEQAPPDYHYHYGDGVEHFGALYLPDSAQPHTVIVLIHGGCYREMYDLKPLGGLARALTRDGFAVWNIEYRRAGNGGDYPNMFLDVAAAADFLPRIAAHHALPLDRVITVGHSAGGHLALWLAGRSDLLRESPLYTNDPLRISGVVALAAVADIAYALEQGVCADSLPTVMGGDPDTAPAHFRDGSPAELTFTGIPQVHIVGSEDRAILQNVRRYLGRKHAVDAKLIIVPDVGHFEIVAIDHPAWQITRRAILDLRTIQPGRIRAPDARNHLP